MDSTETKKLFEQATSGELPLGKTIKLLRKRIKKNQTDFAKLLNIAPRTLMDIERGVGNPRLSTLNKIAEVFGMQIGLHKSKRHRNQS